jgi:acetylornithine aminotransferase
VLGEIERAGLVENARVRGNELRAHILALRSPLITDIQGRGLLLGVGLADPVAPTVASRALDAGLIINAATEHRIRLAPPLIIGEQELAEFTRKFAHALDIPHPTDPGDRA